MADGIGFPYVPEKIEASCITDTCQLSTDYGTVRLHVTYPSDLIYSGSACYMGKIENSFGFHLVGSGTSTPDAITFELASDLCAGRHITLTFRALDWSDGDGVRSDIVLGSTSLYVCVSPTRMAYLCSEDGLIQPDDADKINEAAAAWAKTRTAPKNQPR